MEKNHSQWNFTSNTSITNFTVFLAETGQLFNVNSITKNGHYNWQVNISYNNCGMTTGTNNLNREDVDKLLSHFKNQGQMFLTSYLKSIGS